MNGIDLRVGDFVATEVIGRTPSTVVYKGFGPTESGTESAVAIKVVYSLAGETVMPREFLFQEQLKNWNHPNLPRYFHFEHNRKMMEHYVVMSYIQGQSLDKILSLREQLARRQALEQGRDRPVPNSYGLDPALALSLMIPIMDAVAYMQGHPFYMLHLDIDPMNIVVPSITNPSMNRLVDMGLVRMGGHSTSFMTNWFAKPNFASPEQLRNKGVKFSSDIYMIASTLLYCIVPDWYATQYLRKLGDIELERQHLPSVFDSPQGRELFELIASCMLLDKNKRPASALWLARKARDLLKRL